MYGSVDVQHCSISIPCLGTIKNHSFASPQVTTIIHRISFDSFTQVIVFLSQIVNHKKMLHTMVDYMNLCIQLLLCLAVYPCNIFPVKICEHCVFKIVNLCTEKNYHWPKLKPKVNAIIVSLTFIQQEWRCKCKFYINVEITSSWLVLQRCEC